MPIHDWTRVDAGFFHAFHHDWITEIARVLNRVVPTAVGELLTDMPLFLEPEKAVQVPLEATYTAAFNETPRRWRRVLSPSVS